MYEIILTSSVLILILIALRRVLRGRIAPTLQYALWLLVAVRLLMPGTLFHAPVTVLGFVDGIHSAAVDSLTEETPPAIEPTPPLYTPLPEQTIPVEPMPTLPPVEGDTTSRVPAPQVTPTPQKSAINWWNILWKTGVVTVGSVFLISNLIFYRKLRRNRQRIPTDSLPIPCHLPVYYVESLAAPCLFGVKSAIYVNETALHPQRLRHVLTHELTHHRHGDHLWSLLRCICLAMHWYNPLVWWAAMLSRRDCELSCDSAVLYSLGNTSAISYGETLMAMLTKTRPSLLHTATTMGTEKRTMTERLQLIVHRPKMRKGTAVAVALVAIGAVTLTFGGCSDTGNTTDTKPPIEGTQTVDTPSTEQDNTQSDNISSTVFSGETYTHPSGLFRMELPTTLPVVAVESEDGIHFYDETVYQSGREDGWILSVHPQPADWNGDTNFTWTLATFDTNGTPQNFILEYSSAYSDEFSALRLRIAESFTSFATAEQFSRLIHDNYEENLTLAISYLPYLSWRNYGELYSGFSPDGFYELEHLQNALYQFADSGTASFDQYHDMLSMTEDGLDGAFSQNLSGIFVTLFLRNQERFLSVVNSDYITDTERARVARYVKYELDSQPTEADSKQITFTDAEVISGLSRLYSTDVWYRGGSPEGLTVTLTGDWTLDKMQEALFATVSEAIEGTPVEHDLVGITIGNDFRFPDEMRDGVTLTVPFYATYQSQEAHTLPSGQIFYCSEQTDALSATIQLVG